jgi:hypothetical protein
MATQQAAPNKLHKKKGWGARQQRRAWQRAVPSSEKDEKVQCERPALRICSDKSLPEAGDHQFAWKVDGNISKNCQV